MSNNGIQTIAIVQSTGVLASFILAAAGYLSESALTMSVAMLGMCGIFIVLLTLSLVTLGIRKSSTEPPKQALVLIYFAPLLAVAATIAAGIACTNLSL